MTVPDEKLETPPINLKETILSPVPPLDDKDDTVPQTTNSDKVIDLGTFSGKFTVNEISVSQEQTRAKIAWTFTCYFLILVAIAVLLPFFVNLFAPKTFADPLETAKNLSAAIASILAGPFGFIVGFYFKQTNGE